MTASEANERSSKRREIEELMEELRKLGAQDAFLSPEALDEDQQLEYLRRVVAFENAPRESLFQQLSRRAVELPPPDRLPPGPCRRKLREVRRALADLGVQLDGGRLSPREVYFDLWHDLLRDEYEPLPPESGEWRIELLPDPDPLGQRQYVKYFVKPMSGSAGRNGLCHITFKL